MYPVDDSKLHQHTCRVTRNTDLSVFLPIFYMPMMGMLLSRSSWRLYHQTDALLHDFKILEALSLNRTLARAVSVYFPHTPSFPFLPEHAALVRAKHRYQHAPARNPNWARRLKVNAHIHTCVIMWMQKLCRNRNTLAPLRNSAYFQPSPPASTYPSPESRTLFHSLW